MFNWVCITVCLETRNVECCLKHHNCDIKINVLLKDCNLPVGKLLSLFAGCLFFMQHTVKYTPSASYAMNNLRKDHAATTDFCLPVGRYQNSVTWTRGALQGRGQGRAPLLCRGVM